MLAALAVGGALVAASGCGSSDSSGGGNTNATLRIGIQSGPNSVNPFAQQTQASGNLVRYTYPSLVQYDAQNAISPDFATKWTFSSDGKTLTLTTRSGATWSDGQPMTAKDAAWTLTTIHKFSSGSTAFFQGPISHITSAEAPDDTTVVIHYDASAANALDNLMQMPILPQHVWQKYAAGNGKALKTFSNLPQVAGGPFVVTKFQANSITLLERNAKYFGTKPSIARWGYSVFGTSDAELTALKTNQIDAAVGLPSTAAQALKGDASVKFLHGPPGESIVSLWLNAAKDKTQNPELLNSKVRNAINEVIDRDRINQVAFQGFAVSGGPVIPYGLPGSDDSIKPPALDVNAANQLLDQAGYKRGANGIRVANGHPMSYKLIFFNGLLAGSGLRIVQTIQDGLKQIGIQMTPVPTDTSTGINQMLANKERNWDMAFLSAGTGSLDPDYDLSGYTCSGLGSINITGYCEPAYDKLYNKEGTIQDTGQRFAMVRQMQQMLANGAGAPASAVILPWAVIDYTEALEAWGSKWSGYVPSVLGTVNVFSNLTLTSVREG